MDNLVPLTIINPDDERCERRDAAANRAKVLAAAEALFARHGVDPVTMADVAREAGVGKGTLYRRYANKSELCLALMDDQMLQFQETMLARLRRMALEQVSPVEQLKHFITAVVFFTDTHAPLLTVVQQERLSADDQMQRPHFWQQMTVRGLLHAAVEAGELPPDRDIDYLADALLAPLNTSLFRFQREARGYDLDRIANGLHQLIDGLRHGG